MNFQKKYQKGFLTLFDDKQQMTSRLQTYGTKNKSYTKLPLGNLTDDCFDGDIVSFIKNIDGIQQEKKPKDMSNMVVFCAPKPGRDDYPGLQNNQYDYFFGIKLSQKGIEIAKELRIKARDRRNNYAQTEDDFIRDRNRARYDKRYEIQKKKRLALSNEYGTDNILAFETIKSSAENLIRQIGWNHIIHYNYNKEPKKQPIPKEEFENLEDKLIRLLVNFYKEELEKYYKE